MCYADTTYVLALLKPHTWTNNAEKVKKQIEQQSLEVWGSETTFHEILMYAYNENLDPIRYTRDALCLIQPRGIEPLILLKAAKYMVDYGNSPGDSLHLAHSINTEARMITSDREIKDTLKNIPDTPRYINLRSPNPKI